MPDKFELVPPSWGSTTIFEYRAGKVTVTALAYAFGQYRLQAWYDNGGEYPDILNPVG